MSAEIELLTRIEAAAERGWPALKSRAIQGWLWRFTSGGSIRANSVATHRLRGYFGEVDHAIAACEAAYAAEGAACVFTISDCTVPADLDARLAARGYVRGDDHVTMVKAVDRDTTLPTGVSVGVQPTRGWLEAYLSGLSPNRRDVAPRLIERLGDRAVFVSDETDGVATSSGMTVIDGDLASVQCMATLPMSRRQGGARRVLAGIEAIAAQNECSHLYLQTGGENLSAQRLYEGCGFRIIGRYHTRTRAHLA